MAASAARSSTVLRNSRASWPASSWPTRPYAADPTTVPSTAAADVTTATPRIATSSVTNTDRRESGRASRTSSVPLCRSPAIAAAANPTG